MINKLKSYPKQIDNMTMVHHPKTNTKIPISRPGKTSGKTNNRGRKAPESAILRFRHKPTWVNPTEEDWQLVSLSGAAGCRTIWNQLAEEMNRCLKHERVIKDDADKISTIMGKRKTGNGNRKT
jgi:hypothetical protein